MKLAVLADSHANRAALERVGEEIDAWRPDVVVVGGDVINRGPQPAECLALVLERQRAPGMGRMGSTVVAVLIARAVAHVAWAGDSRAYLLRGGHLRPLTRDHSVVQEMVDRGERSPEEAESHPESHMVTRAVGGSEALEVDLVSVPLLVGDRLLLCSDGLTRCVYEQTVEALLRDASGPEDACQKLLREALDSGAPDNVSAIAVLSREP